MAMVLRKSDMKLLSVSTKKFKVYEAAYCAPLDQELSGVDDRNDEVNDLEPGGQVLNEVDYDGDTKMVGRVHSIKSMRNHTIPVPNTTASSNFRPPALLDASAATQSSGLGEGLYVPEHRAYNVDQLALDLQELETKVKSQVADYSRSCDRSFEEGHGGS